MDILSTSAQYHHNIPRFAYLGHNPSPTIDPLERLEGSTVAIDIETVSLTDRRPLGISFCSREDEAFYFPIHSSALPWHILFDRKVTKVLHNGAYDIPILEEFTGQQVWPLGDTIIMAQLLGLPLSLHSLVQHYFNTSLTQITDLLGPRGKKQKTMLDIPPEQTAEKCAQDALYTRRIYNLLYPTVASNCLVPYLLDVNTIPLVSKLKRLGIGIDQQKLIQYKEQLTAKVQHYRNLAQGMGFNPGSSKQVAAILQDQGYPVQYKRETGNPIMNEDQLTTTYADSPVAQLTLLYRKTNILLTTFIKGIEQKYLNNGRIYPEASLTGVASGRIARSKPNTQNFPAHMRDLFIPTEGYEFEDWDLSQIELRVLAYLVYQETGDYTMQAVFDRGGDIHSDTSIQIYGDDSYHHRRTSKAANFAIGYGGDEYTLWRKNGIPIEVGRDFIARYFTLYKGIKQYLEITRKRLYSRGYVETLSGRRRYFNDLDNPNPQQRRAYEREAFNHIIQGTAAEDLKRLQLRLANERLINTVHDETLMEVPPNYHPDRSLSEHLAPYRTPLEAKRGPNWRDCDGVGVFG